MHKPAQLYLASKSPRRRELLTQWGLNFEVLLNPFDDVSEEPLANEEPIDYVTRVAAEKALSVDSYIQTAGMTRLPVLASDTIVELDGEILRKPADKVDAFKTLKKLSGKTHRVISSVAVIDKNRNFFRTLLSLKCNSGSFLQTKSKNILPRRNRWTKPVPTPFKGELLNSSNPSTAVIQELSAFRN